MNRIGKKGSEWLTVRAQLKKYFNWAGITVCEARLEGCWFHNALGFAHCRKRRLLQDGEIWHVVLLCNPCHDKWEISGHENMHTKIHAIIDKRGLIGPPYILRPANQSIEPSQTPDGTTLL